MSKHNHLRTRSILDPRPRRKRPVMARRINGVLRELGSGVSKLVVLVLLIALAGLVQLNRFEMPPWLFADQAERNAALAWPGSDLSIGSATLHLGRGGKASRIVLRDVVLRGSDGEVLGRAPQVQGGFSAWELLQGRWQPRSLEVVGAEATLARSEDGTLSLSVQPEGQGLVVPGTPTDAPGTVRGFDIASLKSSRPLQGLQEVVLTGGTVRLYDLGSGQSYLAQDADLRLAEVPNNAVRATVRGRFESGATEAIPIFVDVTIPRGPQPVEARLRVEGATPAQLVPHMPHMPWLAALDLPVTAHISARLGDSAMLQDATAKLSFGAGKLPGLPLIGSRPVVPVQSGHVYLDYTARDDRLRVSEIKLAGPNLSLTAEGHADLARDADGVVREMGLDLHMRDIALPKALGFDQVLAFETGHLVGQVLPQAQKMELAQISLADGAGRYTGSASVHLTPQGAKSRFSAQVSDVDLTRALGLWPIRIAPRTREWVTSRMDEGQVPRALVHFRKDPGAAPQLALDMAFERAKGRVLKTLPEIEEAKGWLQMGAGRFDMTLAEGVSTPPEGGVVDLAGSRISLPDLSQRPVQAQARIEASGPVQALLSMIDQPPLGLIARMSRRPDMARGRGKATADLSLPLKAGLSAGDVAVAVVASLRDVRSNSLVPGKALTADALALNATNSQVRIGGDVTLDGVGVQAQLVRDLGPGSDGITRITANMPFSRTALGRLGVPDLPAGLLEGQSQAQVRLDLSTAAQTYDLTTDVSALSLNLPNLGWRKGPGAPGQLQISGTLGEAPTVERISLTAPGLSAQGDMLLSQEGLRELRLSAAKVGSWLQGTVRYRPPRGPSPGVARVTQGSVDLRDLPKFSAGDGPSMRVGFEDMSVRLSQDIVLRDVKAEFLTEGGFQGRLTGRVNGGAWVEAELLDEGRIVLRAANGGEVLRDAGVFPTALGGDLSVTLTPNGPPGHYAGTLRLSQTRVRDTPALAELFHAASIVGLADMSRGPGIGFDVVEGQFELTPQELRIAKGKAVSPSMGISLAGRYSFASRRLAMEGVFSPIYMVNGLFEKVPVLGRLLGGRDGEGLLGMTYTMRGEAGAPQVSVNPISIFTPGAFREIFQTQPGAGAAN
ncbi:MAG: AsmA-like C-terminal region-containing protein [Pseudomonadota bacterium]